LEWEKKTRYHQSSRKTFWPTSHSDFLSCRIQESECKFTGLNKNKNNFTFIIISICSYSLTKISSFSCSGCFQPRATNFSFLVLVMQINCIFLNIVCTIRLSVCHNELFLPNLWKCWYHVYWNLSYPLSILKVIFSKSHNFD
jgi:hypothetical protein